MSSFCLSEVGAGSDAFSLSTRATPSPDCSYYTIEVRHVWGGGGGGGGDDGGGIAAVVAAAGDVTVVLLLLYCRWWWYFVKVFLSLEPPSLPPLEGST